MRGESKRTDSIESVWIDLGAPNVRSFDCRRYGTFVSMMAVEPSINLACQTTLPT